MSNFIILLIFIFASVVHAEKISFTIGSREQSADVGNLGDTAEGKSFQLGFEGVILSEEGVSLISGASYVQRLITIQNHASGGSSTYEGNYLDLPVRAKVSVNRRFDVWGGISLAILLNSRCRSEVMDKSCDIKEQKQLMIPFSVGLNYNFVSRFGLGVFYEMTSDQLPPNDMSQEIGSYRTAGVNFLYYF